MFIFAVVKSPKPTSLLRDWTHTFATRCIQQANGIVIEEAGSASEKALSNDLTLLKPNEIKEFLDTYIIGQDRAKRIMAVAVYNHYKRLPPASKR